MIAAGAPATLRRLLVDRLRTQTPGEGTAALSLADAHPGKCTTHITNEPHLPRPNEPVTATLDLPTDR